MKRDPGFGDSDGHVGSSWVFAVPTLLLTGLLPVTVAAQAFTEVPDRLACVDCRIEIRHQVTLGGADDPDTHIGPPGRLPVDSRGRIYFHSLDIIAGITVFSADGRIIQTIGRSGQGPGEFSGPVGVHIALGDTLFAFDFGSRRLTVFDPDYDIVRSAQIEVVANGDGYFFGDDRFVAAQVGRSADTFGFPLHVLTRTGEYLRSFGGDYSRAISRRDLPRLRRRIAAGPNGTTWATHAFSYDIELYGPDGNRLRGLRRRPAWFPEVAGVPTRPLRPDDAPPYAMAAGVQQDESGRLWLLSWVAAEEWPTVLANQPSDAPTSSGLWDTMIEVIDPEAGMVLARQRIPDRALGFSAPGVIYTYNDEELYPRIDLWRLRVSSAVPGGLR